MALTDNEQQELDRLEIVFEAAGGRGVEMADRIDFLRAKSEFPTVRQLVDHLLQELEIDPDTTFVVLEDSEVDYPMEYVALKEVLREL